MKVFILSLVAAVILAAGTGFILDDMMSRSADATFATSSTRVGDSGSIAERNFSGGGE